jgi:hypothetical protein
MKRVVAIVLGIIAMWCLVGLIIGMCLLGDYSPFALAVILITAFGAGIGACFATSSSPYEGYL